MYIYYLFYVLYNNQSRTTCIWSWNFTHFLLYYIIIIVFYACKFWSAGDLFTRWVIDLFSPPRIRCILQFLKLLVNTKILLPLLKRFSFILMTLL